MRYPVLVFALLLFSMNLGGSVHALSLEEIQSAIHQHGALWSAGNNKVWDSSPSERRARLGAILEEHDLHVPQRSGASTQVLPVSFDWRSLGVVTPVKDQGKCGSCWAFATVGALESVVLINHGAIDLISDFSEQFLVSYNLTNDGCSGGSLSKAAQFLKEVGAVSEQCKPYTETDRKLPPPCEEWSDQLTGIASWVGIAKNVNALKQAVFDMGPVSTDFNVYEDFFSYKSGAYSHVIGRLVGAHAVLIVGWDDIEQCFIVKNSWGQEWGEKGYFRIAYSQVDNEVAFGTGSVAYAALWRKTP